MMPTSWGVCPPLGSVFLPWLWRLFSFLTTSSHWDSSPIGPFVYGILFCRVSLCSRQTIGQTSRILWVSCLGPNYLLVWGCFWVYQAGGQVVCQNSNADEVLVCHPVRGVGLCGKQTFLPHAGRPPRYEWFLVLLCKPGLGRPMGFHPACSTI